MFSGSDISDQFIDLVMELVNTLTIHLINLSLVTLQLSHLGLENFYKMLIKLSLGAGMNELLFRNNLQPSPSFREFGYVIVFEYDMEIVLLTSLEEFMFRLT